MHTSTDSRPRHPRHAIASARRPAARARTRVAGIAGLVLLAVTVWLAWAAERPPAPEPASAPPQTFSAERAMRHLERIAGDEATPVGSAGGDAIRDYLVEQLTTLGLDVEVQAGVGAHAFDTITAGRAENVIALIPGHDPTGRVVLAAHYDSPTTSPGTSDDKMSVAAILEIARALTSVGQLRNDVVVLLSDGEEPGLIGAEAFARHHPYAADGGVMINLEGPGNAGPSTLYNTTADNAGLVAEFARSVPRAVGESAVSEVYRAGPFNSDLTVLREFGFVGLELGPIGGRTYYHHPRDTVENLSQASLQHHGENGLAMVRALADRDLDDLRSTGDATFFSFFGQTVHYPMTFVWPLAALGVAAVLGLAVLARTRRLTSVPRLLAAVLLAALPLVAAPLAAVALWRLLVWLRPAYAHLMSAQPYRPQLYMFALVTATAAVLVVWFLAARRRVGAAALSIGALLWPAVLGVVMAALVPGMSAYGSLTALAGALGAGAFVANERSAPVSLWRAAALTAGALPGAVLWSVGGRSLLSALGVGMAFPAVAFFVLGALPTLPLLALALPEGGRRRWGHAAVPAALVAATVVLVAGGLVVDRTDADHPDTAHLMYVQDADAGTARWGTVDASPHPWAARYVPHTGDRDATAPLPFGIGLARTGPAEPTPLPPPEVTVLEQREEADATVLRLRVRSGRDAYAVGVHLDRPVRAATVEVPGHPATELPASRRDPSSPWPWEVQFHDPPAEGIELTLTVPGTGRPRIGVSDWTNGLDAVPGYEPRPPDVVRQPAGAPSDAVVVTRVLEP